MKFGIWSPLPHTVQHEPRMLKAVENLTTQGKGMDAPDPSFEFVRDVVTRAENYGFDVTLVAERLLGPDLESWVLASALASCTKKIELMVAVHAGGILSPAMVAKMGASLDRISGGRMSVNVINGWWQQELNQFGSQSWLEEPEARAARMGEFVDVISAMWKSSTIDYAGEYYTYSGAELPIRPVQADGPKLYAAGRSPSSRRIVSQKCDCWFAEYSHHYSEYEKNVVQLQNEIRGMKAEAASHGRQIECGISVHVIVEETMEKAHEKAAALEAYGAQSQIAKIAANAMGPGLIGTAEVVAERLALYREAGVDLTMIKFSPMEEQLERFSETVLPLLGKTQAAAA